MSLTLTPIVLETFTPVYCSTTTICSATLECGGGGVLTVFTPS